MKTKDKYKGLLKKILIVITAFSIYYFIPPIKKSINQMVLYLSMLNVEALKEYILSFGAIAPIISFLLMILQSVVAPLPAFLITFANAALFGWWRGAILSWTSSMAGAALCFYIARFLGRGFVEKLTSKFAIDNIDKFFCRYGKHTVLIARLLPFISFDIVSYASGLTSMSFLEFFIATGLGQLPATIAYSYVGGMLVGGIKLMVIGLTTLFALSIGIFVFKKIWNEKQNKKLTNK